MKGENVGNVWRRMRKRGLVLLASMLLMLCAGSITVLAEDVFDGAFRCVFGEFDYSSLKVGDEIGIKPNKFSYEVIEGEDCLEMRPQRSDFEFTKLGTVKIKVTPLDVPETVEKIYEFHVVSDETTIEYYVPERMKLGDGIGLENEIVDDLFKIVDGTLSYELGCNTSELTMDSWEEHFITMSGWGGDFYGDEYRTGRGWLPGIASAPGIFQVSSEMKPDEIVPVVIEEPVITSNLPQQVLVGSTLDFTTALENTSLINMPVEETKRILKEEVFDALTAVEYPQYLGYEPSVEVIEGSELIQRENQNYNNILSTSERVRFLKEGEVTFRVTYNMIKFNELGVIGAPLYASESATYNPETTFTVKVVADSDVVLDYTGGNAPTQEEIQAEISNVIDGGIITFKVSNSIKLNSDTLKLLKDGSHPVVVQKVDEAGKTLYTYKIETFTNTNVELDTDILLAAENEEITTLLKEYENVGNSVVCDFVQKGQLPGSAELSIYVGDDFSAKQEIYLYMFNDQTKTLEKVGKTYAVDENGYVTISIDNGASYVFTESELIKKTEPIVPDEPNTPDTPNEPSTPNKPNTSDQPNTSDNVNSPTNTNANETPKTGDSTSIAVYMILVFICVLGVGSAVYRLYFKKN